MKLRLWSESHRLIVTAAGCAANVRSMAAADQCVTASTWPRLVAAHHNPILRSFYLRLRAAGKPAKLALTATMRKLLIVLNSALKTDLSYA